MPTRIKKKDLAMVNDALSKLKIIDHQTFLVKNNYPSGFDLYLVIKQKEHWVFSAPTLGIMHTYLCLIKHLIQTKKLARPNLVFCPKKCGNVRHTGKCYTQ